MEKMRARINHDQDVDFEKVVEEREKLRIKYLSELRAEDGIESWVRSGRSPIIRMIEINGERGYIAHLPPEGFNEHSRICVDDDGYACYLNSGDEEKTAFFPLFLSVQEGMELVDRYVKESRKIDTDWVPLQRSFNEKLNPWSK
jgi:hypothetical protein